jgi:hypothetical protein
MSTDPMGLYRAQILELEEHIRMLPRRLEYCVDKFMAISAYLLVTLVGNLWGLFLSKVLQLHPPRFNFSSKLPSPEVTHFKFRRKRWPWSRPQEFHRFSDLPTELRLHIWREIFPPAGAFLLDGRIQSFDRLDPVHFWLPENREPPVTLYINSESRKETRRHYRLTLNNSRHDVILQIIQISYSMSMIMRRKPIWFNPRKDVGFLHIQHFISADFYNFAVKPVKGMDRRSATFRTLALVETEWIRGTEGIWDADLKKPRAKGLRRFPFLEEIWLVGEGGLREDVDKEGQIYHAQRRKENLEEMKRGLNLCFEWENRESLRCRVPNVVLFEDMEAAVGMIPGGGFLAQETSLVRER